MIFLRDAERAQLRAQHKRERDKRICDRIKAVLLYDKGWSIGAIAEALLLSQDAIQLHFLPPYSPNLNPIERLWKWMKERVIYNTYYREFEDFKSAVFGFFTTLSSLAAESVLGKDFRSRIRDRFRPIRAPTPS
jgi:transposase